MVDGKHTFDLQALTAFGASGGYAPPCSSWCSARSRWASP
jgi:hypothetical protein